MDKNINVKPETLMEFSNYVKGFSGRIQSDCQNLGEAFKALEVSMDNESVQDIAEKVKQIKNLLENGEPALQDLSAKVERFAEFLHRLQQIANG